MGAAEGDAVTTPPPLAYAWLLCFAVAAAVVLYALGGWLLTPVGAAVGVPTLVGVRVLYLIEKRRQ